jgi:feruloyl-CoA synthase
MTRIKAIAALSPIAMDVVVTGHDRAEIGFLIFPHVDACRKLCSDFAGSLSMEQVLTHPRIRSQIAIGLAILHAGGGGTSTFATRALLMQEPPSIDAGEITDKGYINQRAVLMRREALVTRLYQADAVEVIRLNEIQPTLHQPWR